MTNDDVAAELRIRIGVVMCDGNPYLSAMLDRVRLGQQTEVALIECLRDVMTAAQQVEDRLLVELLRRQRSRNGV